MAVHVILSRFSPGSFTDPHEFKRIAKTVSEKIKNECPGVVWKDSYCTMGRYDAIDIVESDDVKEIQKAAMIIRSYGRSLTETLPATPWKQFINNIE